MRHLLLLLNLAHAFVFFLQGEISYMVTLLLALEASDESLLWLKLYLGGLGALLFCPGAALLLWDEALPLWDEALPHPRTSTALSGTVAFWTICTSPYCPLTLPLLDL
jgi:hypothetical protein